MSMKGGIAFIGLKGIFKIYYKQQQFLRQAHRQIKNYDAGASSNSTSTQTGNSTSSSSSSNLQSQHFNVASMTQNTPSATGNNITRRYRQVPFGSNSTDSILTTPTTSSVAPNHISISTTPLNIDTDMNESRKVHGFNFKKTSVSTADHDVSSSSSSTSSANLESDTDRK